MNTNSNANSSPAAIPAGSVPSRPNSAAPCQRAQRNTSSVATTERMPPCMSSETSGAVSLIGTCWMPQTIESTSIVPNAVPSSAFRS